MRGADPRMVASVAHAIIDADGVTAEDLVRVHRALAKESGATHAEAEIAVAEADRALLRAGAAPADRSFERDRWEREFLQKLKTAGASGEGPAAAIAAERDRLRAFASLAGNVADAGAIEEGLGRLAELSMKGYASVTDPPLVISSTGNSTNRLPVAAMPSRLDTVGPVPSMALKGALEAATARTGPVQRQVQASVQTSAQRPMALPKAPPAAKVKLVAVQPRQAIKPVSATGAVPRGVVRAEPLPPVAKPDPIAEMTGISPAMARIRAMAAQKR
jgi:hypothetical protein